jgi:aspartate/methionine/tyrosine aminotransferase
MDLKKDAHIALNHGSNYGDRHSTGHFRVPYLPSEKVLEKIYAKLETFMKNRVS